MTAGVFITSKKRNSSSSFHVRRRRRSVSATILTTKCLHPAHQRINDLVDMLEMRSETEDRTAQTEAAINARSTQHDPALLLNVADQLFIELIDIGVLREISEGND